MKDQDKDRGVSALSDGLARAVEPRRCVAQAIQWTGKNLRPVQDFLAPSSPYTQDNSGRPCCRLGINIAGDLQFLNVGSWLVRHEDGRLEIYLDGEFRCRFWQPGQVPLQ